MDKKEFNKARDEAKHNYQRGYASGRWYTLSSVQSGHWDGWNDARDWLENNPPLQVYEPMPDHRAEQTIHELRAQLAQARVLLQQSKSYFEEDGRWQNMATRIGETLDQIDKGKS